MIDYAMMQTIITLWEQGSSQREIAKLVNKSRNAVIRAIAVHETTYTLERARLKRASKLGGYNETIIGILEKGLSAVRILQGLNSVVSKGIIFIKVNSIR